MALAIAVSRMISHLLDREHNHFYPTTSRSPSVYLSGLSIARCRSMAMAVSVNTDTDTLTHWTKGQN